jgi:hypothetical protein
MSVKGEYRNLAQFANGLSGGQEWAGELLEHLGKHELYSEISKDGLLWIQAAYDFDHGDPSLLASILKRGDTLTSHPENVSLPLHASAMLADIVTGQRKVKKKSVSQMKGDHSARWIYLVSVIIYGKGLDVIRRNRTDIADDLGVEADQVMQLAKLVHGTVRGVAMKKLDIRERTLDDLLKNIRERLKNYPKL